MEQLQRDLNGSERFAIFKNGRSTGPTAGLANKVEPNVSIGYKCEGNQYHVVQGKALVIGRLNDWDGFAIKGDSGSLVIDDNGWGVGILFSVMQIYATAYVTPCEAVKKDMAEMLGKAGQPVREIEII